MTALAAGAAMAFASPAFAADANCPTCVVNPDPTGTPLDYPIYGDPVKATNGTLDTVYGSAPNNNGPDNVTFTGNTPLWISEGFAQVQDGGTQGDLTALVINPDDVFSLFEFSTQLEGTSGTVYVYYLLTGSGLDANNIMSYIDCGAYGAGSYCGSAGAYTSGKDDNANYLLSGANFDGFLLATSNGAFSLFQAKQMSYTGPNTVPTPLVPEPGTWALMLLGFAGVGMTMRSRRRKDAHLAQIA
jgi:PEP-CTERM motif